jgi:hypothetical protein
MAMHIDELKQVDKAEWDIEFAALSAKSATQETYVQVHFRLGHLCAKVCRLWADGSTICARLSPQSLPGKPDDDIRLEHPEIEDGMYHLLAPKTGGRLLMMGFHLCSHGEYGEVLIATDPALFALKDSYAPIH